MIHHPRIYNLTKTHYRHSIAGTFPTSFWNTQVTMKYVYRCVYFEFSFSFQLIHTEHTLAIYIFLAIASF